MTGGWRGDILAIEGKNQALTKWPMIPEIEREKSEFASLVCSAECHKSSNYRTAEAKGSQNAPKSNGKPENRNIYSLNRILIFVVYYYYEHLKSVIRV